MERLYALEVSCIQLVQYWFKDYEFHLELVNEMSKPHNVLEYICPLVSILDSVFAAQLCLCCAFGVWLNTVMERWLFEDRPYRWVCETNFYADSHRPVLRQTRQSCESGPGSPAGHSAMAAILVMLCVLWASHVYRDRKLVLWWWNYVAWGLGGAALLAVMVARIYVATHFPHQVVLGSLLGAFLAPALCTYVVDPHVWTRGQDRTIAQLCFLASGGVTVLTVILTYVNLYRSGWDPLWTVKLAFRWCKQPANIHPSMFALAHSAGHLLGWALAVTPAVARYRYYTKHRTIIISIIVTALQLFMWPLVEQNISKDIAWEFYMTHFFECAIKPLWLLRSIPAISMWVYKKDFEINMQIRSNELIKKKRKENEGG